MKTHASNTALLQCIGKSCLFGLISSPFRVRIIRGIPPSPHPTPGSQELTW